MRKVLAQSMLPIIFISLSFLTAVLLITDLDKPTCYQGLFLVPLVFCIVSIVFYQLYSLISYNLGASLIILLIFCRTVLSPLFMYLGHYTGSIAYNIDQNTFYAILLVCYETVCIFIVLIYKMGKNRVHLQAEKNDSIKKELNQVRLSRKYEFLVVGIILIFFICYLVAPEFMDNYRTVFQLNDKFFANHEDYQITRLYGTTFMKKLAIVTGNYLMRAALILVPGILLIKISQIRSSGFTRVLSFAICFMPLLFIGGAIARSLIYMVILFLLRNYLFAAQYANKKFLQLIAIAGVIVIAYWFFKMGEIGMTNFMESMSGHFNAYFSGINVVSGVFNLPHDIVYKLRYFIYDYLGSFPYGTTIFGLQYETVSEFFNSYNHSSGQIPTTIGMGYYYFGPLLAPLYSMLFAGVAFDTGNKLNKRNNPLKQLRLLITVFWVSFGIIVYNIEILFTCCFTLLLPLYFMEKLAYPKEK